MKKKTPAKKKNISKEKPKKDTIVSAKGKVKKEEEPKEITLEYKLHELPSSQHKAGLAGLYLVIDWLDKQDINKELIQRTEISETGLRVTLTKKDVKDLFDEIYKLVDVERITKSEPKKGNFESFEKLERTIFYFYEVESKSKRKDKETKKDIAPLREVIKSEIDKKTGKAKEVKYYIYEEKFPEIQLNDEEEEIEPIRQEEIEDTVIYYKFNMSYPNGSFIKSRDNSNEGLWISLWRESQWIIKGDRQRLIYENPQSEAESFWEKVVSNKQENDLSKVVFLSAQSNNAEKVDFKERTINKFLLHFYGFASQPYAYWTKEKIKFKTEEHGFIFAVPDIVKLKSFVNIFNSLNRENDLIQYPKRPLEGVVFTPSVAGLLLLKNIRDVLTKKINSDYMDVVSGIDLFHYDYVWNKGKPKTNRASLFKGYTRVKPDFFLESKIAYYNKIYHNYFFKKLLLENTLRGKYELSSIYNLFCTMDYKYFFNYWEGEFKPDAKTYFEEIKIKGEQEMKVEEKIPKAIESLVYQIVQTYVFSKLESKYQIIWDQERKTLWSKSNNAPANDDDYKNKGKIAKDAFLAIRSRKDREDFITYFTSTICSVPHRLGEEGYKVLVESLYNKNEELGWEKVRALSMLALSANS
jgi:CRISPR-associated protein Cmx8